MRTELFFAVICITSILFCNIYLDALTIELSLLMALNLFCFYLLFRFFRNITLNLPIIFIATIWFFTCSIKPILLLLFYRDVINPFSLDEFAVFKYLSTVSLGLIAFTFAGLLIYQINGKYYKKLKITKEQEIYKQVVCRRLFNKLFYLVVILSIIFQTLSFIFNVGFRSGEAANLPYRLVGIIDVLRNFTIYLNLMLIDLSLKIKRRNALKASYVFLAINVVVTIMCTSSRYVIVIVIIGIAIIYILNEKSFNVLKRNRIKIAVCVAALALITPLIGYYRLLRVPTYDLFLLFDYMKNIISAQSVMVYLTDFFSFTLLRFIGPEFMFPLIESKTTLGLENIIKMYMNDNSNIIYYYTHEIMLTPYSVVTGATSGYWGELYVFYGECSVVVGTFIFIIMISIIWRTLVKYVPFYVKNAILTIFILHIFGFVIDGHMIDFILTAKGMLTQISLCLVLIFGCKLLAKDKITKVIPEVSPFVAI